MTIKELVERLQKFPPDMKVYYEGGDFKDDWREVRMAQEVHWYGIDGVLLE